MAKNFIANQVFVDIGLTPDGKLEKFITATVAKHMDKYVPFREGTLARTVIIDGQPTDNVKSDKIIYQQPYASYIYKGLSKYGKSLNYDKSKHSYAGPYWDERCMTAERDTIVREIQKQIDRGV